MRGSYAVLALLALTSTNACNVYVVTTRYETLAAYEDRGWLPTEILPPSTRAILTENNLDTNTSRGHFEFDPKDAAVFLAKVKAGPPRWLSDAKEADTFAGFRTSGMTVWHYSESGNEWALFCDLDAARCDYRM